MAQLSDDCFAFGGPLMTVDECERLITERIAPVSGTERISVRASRGRVLADDVRALVSLPPFDNSAVDGYAVRFSDLAAGGETRLPVTGRLQAGSAASRALSPGTAVRIFTGAPMPAGADTVFMQEDCTTDGNTVILPAGLKFGANRRKQGEDVVHGAVVLRSGTRLAPQHIAMASATGATELTVRRRIRVALFSTGDEIAEPGTPLPTAAIYDANRPLLAEMARTLGADVTDLGILRDDVATLEAALSRAASNHDLVLTSGGVSTGEADFVRTALERAGTLTFWRVAIKPGRPVALGVLRGGDAGQDTEQQAAFAGLPGNPVAAFVTFARIVRPLILRLAGAIPEPLLALPARAAFSYRKKEGRREYVRVSLKPAAGGGYEAIKYRQDGAGVISSMTETDGLVELPEDVTSIEPGASVGYLSYAAIMGCN
jgi:molybdopterin molybdotransferase